MLNGMDPLIDLVRPDRLTIFADIGANPIDGDPPYKEMVAKRLCRVIGFEPQNAALTVLNSRKSDLETYLPYAVGDGGAATLKVCRMPGMSSLLQPDRKALAHFPGLAEWGEVVAEIPLRTRRLDDIDEIDEIDFLKIDVQGSELTVFQNGRARLAKAIGVQAEVSFVTIYERQPSFGAIDLFLRELGFVPHCLWMLNKRLIAPMETGDPHAALNQLLEADVVYVRDFMRADLMDSEQLKHLAIVAHHCYGSYDLTFNCIFHLIKRNQIGKDAEERYLKIVNAQSRPAAE